MSELFTTVLHTTLLIVLPIVGALAIISLLRDRSRNKDIKKGRAQQEARAYVENIANQMNYKIRNGIPLSDIENVCINNNNVTYKHSRAKIPLNVVTRILTDEDKLRIAYNKYVEKLLSEYNKGHISYGEYTRRYKKLKRRFDELLRQLRQSDWL